VEEQEMPLSQEVKKECEKELSHSHSTDSSLPTPCKSPIAKDSKDKLKDSKKRTERSFETKSDPF
jgi:hypothetical protein